MHGERLYRDEKIGKLIQKTAVPSVVIILVMMVYNMADMFFIGQTGDTLAVAAVSLCGPLMSILSGLGTLLGSGGCAAIANALGEGNKKRVREMSSFSAWASIGLGVLFSVFVLVFMPKLTGWIGASADTSAYTMDYMRIIAIGAPAMIFSSAMANMVRAEGAVKEAMIGNILGSLLNIALDPLFISVFDLGVSGAAIATVISNIVAALFFVFYIQSKKSMLTLSLKSFTLRRETSLKVLALGVPTAFGVLLMSLSSIVRNSLAVGYGDDVIAAMGVAGRVAMIVSMVQMGICMGVQPAIGYNFGAKLYKRMKAITKWTGIAAVAIGTVLTIAVFAFRTPLVAMFIQDGSVIDHGTYMVIISMVTGPIFGLSILSTTFLQATDKAFSATITSILRQGVFLLPLSYLANWIFSLNGLLWAPAVADILATLISVIMFLRQYRRIKAVNTIEMPSKLAA